MKKWIIAGLAIAIVIAGIIGATRPGKEDQLEKDMPFAEAQKGDLVIDVLEGGNIQALNFLEFRNEVSSPGGVKILEIIDEGYYVTEEDVAKGKVLVRLDQTELEEAIVDHDVQFQQTESAYAEAKQNIEIQESEALSDIKAERQVLRFALLDFQKFVGAKAAEMTLKKLGLPFGNESLAAYEKEATDLIASAFDTKRLAQDTADETEATTFAIEVDDSLAANVNFGSFLKEELLGDGEAEQTIRRMRDEALVASSELAVVEESVEGAKRLREREFITKQTLENELVGLDKARLALVRSETEMELFRDYEFPKEAEKMLSFYEEALLSLIRSKREKMAMMSQIYAKYRSAKRRYELELKKRENLEIQLAGCIIRAQKPGLVAYGGANANYYSSRFYDGISSGATLKNGQPIITIPDMSKLGVEVNIHESHIKKIELGQKVYITAESVPDKLLIGKITKVAVLPDSNASRYNPSLKVYPATVEIEGTHEFLKPGMSAKVEIIVDELEDVTYIPVQAVFVENSEHFVFLKTLTGYQRQLVEIGAHNNDFIELKKGVEAGDSVFLKMPDSYEPAKLKKSQVARGDEGRKIDRGSGSSRSGGPVKTATTVGESKPLAVAGEPKA
ncbi:MAG: efflux RND transporter periplasmic adaptor subunit [Verrucomicrobiales bacterium]|jgi:HlyD family secretion protein|nr:efflux RND transporter periplasmic adaptor subunit [Verrucomicrobiales bacterium]MBP9223032.1 efflux RND transporter periplasmic adaptor subunit [Verrucomicrobiales bacterium]HQZ27061.1 efflux RND transporter periplasmic adaptor subunit [Verrucomicrobiales bacterium]